MLSRNTLLLLCVSVPSFMINLDANIVAVSLSSIARSLHADFAAIEWVISGYTLAFATLLLPAGALADRFGRKNLLMLGLVIFTVASGFCGAAPTTGVLNVARVFQGAGAALQLSAALAILSHGFHGRERAKAFAFWGSVIGIAIALGPVAGGLITQIMGWEWAFYINLPIGAVMIVLTHYSVQESKDPNAVNIDLAGVATFTGFLGLLTWALISGNHLGWGSTTILMQLSGSAFFLLAFLAVELKQQRPMVDLHYFIRPTYLGATIAGVSYAAAFITMLTYVPFFFQSGLGRSPLSAGLLMLPLAVPMFVVPRIISVYFDHRMSGRTMLTIGLGLVGAGSLITALNIGSFNYPLLLGSMLIASTGAGILNGQVAKVGMSVIPVERAGMASGISATVRFSGIVVGFAGLGAILFDRIQSFITSGLPQMAVADQLEITHLIANGNVVSAAAFIALQHGDASLAKSSLGYGYGGVFWVAAIIALTAMVLSWLLIRAHETAPHGAAGKVPHLGMPLE